jgi:amidase
VGSANIGARPGYPTVTVPFGFVTPTPGTGANAFPAGFELKPSPYNVSFTGTACSEAKLIELGYGFEQATKKRIAPPLFP